MYIKASLFLIPLFCSGSLHAQDLSLSASVDFAAGSYGLEEDTQTLSIPIAASVSFDRVTISGNLPFIWTDGPAEVARATSSSRLGSRLPRLNAFLQARNEEDNAADAVSGLGDASLALRLDLLQRENTIVSLTSGATLSSGDSEKGLGTGATDVWLGGDLEQAFGAISVFIYGDYTWVGDNDSIVVSETEVLPGASNYASLGVGAAYRANSNWSGAISLNWREAVFDELDDELDTNVQISRRLTDRLSLTGRLGVGLSENSADVSSSIGFRWRNLRSDR